MTTTSEASSVPATPEQGEYVIAELLDAKQTKWRSATSSASAHSEHGASRPAAHDAIETRRVVQPSALELVELLLKEPAELERLVRTPDEQPLLVPRLLAVALACFTIFGVPATVALNASSAWPAYVPAASWHDLSAANLTLAYAIGCAAAIGVCLPSFYFYTLLAGVRLSMLTVTAHAMKALAAGAVALVGILPIALAVVLGAVVFNTPAWFVESAQYALLLLPLVSGLYAVYTLYRGFWAHAELTLGSAMAERAVFVDCLVVAWSVCYTAVTPLMVYSLWNYFAS